MSTHRTAALKSAPQTELAVVRLSVKLLVQILLVLLALDVILTFVFERFALYSNAWNEFFTHLLAGMVLLPILYRLILKPVAEVTRRQVEQTAEARFEVIAEAAQEGLLICDQQMNIRFANAAAEKMLEYEPRTLRGTNAMQLLSEDSAEFATQQVETFRATGDAPILHAGVIEIEGRRKSGQTFPMDISVSRLPGGNDPEFVVILRDSSQRKLMEEFLRQSEAHFRMLADTAPVMIWLTDAEGRCTYVNKRWLEFTGRQWEHDLGAGWAESIHEEDRQDELRSFQMCIARRAEFASEYRLRRADGEYRWIFDHGMPRFAPDGTLAGYIGACFDVTERKTAEQALRESEAKFRALTETAASGIFISRDDRLLYVNAQTERVTGYSRDELLGTPFWRIIHPDFQALVRARREARLSGEKVAPRYEFKICTRSGEERWIDFTATSIEYEGQPAILGTAFDITERKLAEQKLAEQTAMLDALVQSNPLAMVTVNAEGRAQLCNPAFEKLFQYTSQELLGQPLDEMVSPSEKLEEAKALTACNVSGEYRVLSTTRRKKNGTLVEVEIHAVPLVVQGRTIGSFGIYVDLTERMKLQMYEKLLPVCCMCGKIRDDSGKKKGKGEWERLDHYVMKHSDARVSHTFCPHCLEEYKKQEGLK